MKRNRTSTVAVALPSQVNTGTEGFFTNGNPGAGVPSTQMDQAWCNGVTEEVRAVIVEVGELSPSGTDLGQMAEAVHGARALRASETGGATEVSTKSTVSTKALLAATTSTAAGSGNNVAMACVTGSAGGSRTLVGAVQTSSVGSSCTEDVILAADSCHIGLATGPSNCAIVACELTTIAGSIGDTAAVACDGCALETGLTFVAACDSVTTATGFKIGALACVNSTCNGTGAVILAGEDVGADGSLSLTAASYDAETDAAQSASIACHATNIGASRTSAVLLASKNAELGDSYSVALGYHASVKPTFSDSNQNLTIRLKGTTGDIYCDGTAGAGAADVAEYVENGTGAPLEPGLLVVYEATGVRLAQPGDDVDGVTSAAPMLIGNAAPLNWSGRHVRDEWDRRILADVPHVRWPELTEDYETPTTVRSVYDGPVPADTVQIPASAVRYIDTIAFKMPDGATVHAGVDCVRWDIETPGPVRTRRRVVRPAYNGPESAAPTPIPDDAERYSVAAPQDSDGFDPARRYVPRADRPEAWTAVAMMGQIKVRVADGVAPGVLLDAGKDGVGVAAKRGARPGGARLKVIRITQPYDAAKGYAIAHCWMR